MSSENRVQDVIITMDVRVVSNIIVQVRLQMDLESYGVWIGYGVVSK